VFQNSFCRPSATIGAARAACGPPPLHQLALSPTVSSSTTTPCGAALDLHSTFCTCTIPTANCSRATGPTWWRSVSGRAHEVVGRSGGAAGGQGRARTTLTYPLHAASTDPAYRAAFITSIRGGEVLISRPGGGTYRPFFFRRSVLLLRAVRFVRRHPQVQAGVPRRELSCRSSAEALGCRSAQTSSCRPATVSRIALRRSGRSWAVALAI
jgi:hypothetical protein